MLTRRAWPSRPTFDSSLGDFDQLRTDMLRMLDSLRGDPLETGSAGVFPPLNVSQDDDHFYVRAEIPGVHAKELSISAVKNRLSIAGRREIPREHERVSYHRKERAEGSFARTLSLPSDVNVDRIEARYLDGILTITLPKAEETKPRQISIKS